MSRAIKASRGKRIARWGAILVVATALVGVGAGILLQHHYESNVEHFGDPFAQVPAMNRPVKPHAKSMTILVLGSDSRISAGDPTQWTFGAQRTDAIMLVHLPADRSRIQLTSIPRDTWVPIPGHHTAKINAAYAWGGPALMVRTVESVTGVRIDHVLISDFTSFENLTNDLGGVQLGGRHMNGVESLAYVRQRHGLKGEDFARVKRQQEWIRAVAGSAIEGNVLANPLRLHKMINTTTRSIAVDDAFTTSQLRSTALSLRGLSDESIVANTAPIKGSGHVGAQYVLYLDTKKAQPIWSAMRNT